MLLNILQIFFEFSYYFVCLQKINLNYRTPIIINMNGFFTVSSAGEGSWGRDNLEILD